MSRRSGSSFELNAQAQAVMACVDAFEQSSADEAGDLRNFLASAPHEYRPTALAELIRVDFERRWKRGQSSCTSTTSRTNWAPAIR
jgi:hypothetical protein